jgi:signal transduction histidine kinase
LTFLVVWPLKTHALSGPLSADSHIGSIASRSGNPMLVSACQTSATLADTPSANSEQACIQLLDHTRSVLISLLSYKLQTPLATIQIAVETLIEGDTIPAQAQRRMLALALAELQDLCLSIEEFLAYASNVWSATLEFLQSRSNPDAIGCLHSILIALPQQLEVNQPWMETARTRLIHFLQSMDGSSNQAGREGLPQQVALLEQSQRQMLAIVNHELRTPLVALRICLESLQQEDTLSVNDQQALLEVACEDLKRLCALVQDLELLCRLEAGQVCFNTELVDLRATLQATINCFLKQTPESVLSKIWLKSANHLSSVWTDGDRLVEVLKRLLGNACRFTTTAGEIRVNAQIVISRDTQPSSHPNSMKSAKLAITISDTGRGINAEQLEHIFDCFYQEEDYLQRTTNGMGIGLTICRYLIEGMGGQIWAESPGKHQGSRFCFTLPVNRETEKLVG